VSSGKRQRQEATRRRVEEAQAEQRRADRTRRLVIGGSLLAAVAIVASIIVLVATHHKSSDVSAPPATVRATTASDFGTGACPRADGSSPRKTTFTSAPSKCITFTDYYVANFDTSAGSFRVALDAAKAPVTVNNFVVLALYHYYDGTIFHRAIPGYIVQGGDANGHPPGSGSPGYTIADELPTSVSDYAVGSIAMANTGAPHSGGSQFFFWMGPNPLPGPNYSLFGKVVSGLDVVRKIEATGSPSGTVTAPVTIHTVTIGTAQVTSR
jgi:cyclophilin family peptidyl-prolyl cis-trans isomerase